ncbi:hypothetical protein B0H13DRAFT_1851590 [Mycena leptocephala]|nr:hypothetical protein B0H13DRAFT_1851590 [Mycena leptocephala]
MLVFQFLFVLAASLRQVNAALRNITVDPTDPAITYAGNDWTLVPNVLGNDPGGFSGPGANLTTIALDDGPPIVLDLGGRNPASDSVVWGMSELTNGSHTFVDSATGGSGEVGGFIYTVEEPDAVPQPPAGTKNVFLSADAFNYSDNWANSTDPVPSCINSGHVHTTSTVNSTFSFNFTGTPTRLVFAAAINDRDVAGEELFLNTLGSTTGGMLSLSINDGPPEVFALTAPAMSCALFNLNATALVKRSLARRGGSVADVQNQCTGKSVAGTTAIDGATYRQVSLGTHSKKRIYVSVEAFTQPPWVLKDSNTYLQAPEYTLLLCEYRAWVGKNPRQYGSNEVIRETVQTSTPSVN